MKIQIHTDRFKATFVCTRPAFSPRHTFYITYSNQSGSSTVFSIICLSIVYTLQFSFNYRRDCNYVETVFRVSISCKSMSSLSNSFTTKTELVFFQSLQNLTIHDITSPFNSQIPTSLFCRGLKIKCCVVSLMLPAVCQIVSFREILESPRIVRWCYIQ